MLTRNAKASHTFAVGSKVYGVCDECAKVVRVNKPLVGGAHWCSPRVVAGKLSGDIKRWIMRFWQP